MRARLAVRNGARDLLAKLAVRNGARELLFGVCFFAMLQVRNGA